MSRFDRYLLSQLMMLFGFFSLVLVSVYWVNRAVRLFDQLISDGQTAWVFLEFTALSLPYVIRLALPVAAFVATVYVTNRLSGESELVVMQATGFSPWRMARPVMVFGLIVAVLLSLLLHLLVPASRALLAERTDEIAQNVTAGLLVEGTFLHPGEGVTFYVREITPQGELVNVFLSDARSRSARTTYTAQRAFVVKGDSGPKLVMFDGLAQTLQRDDQRLFVTRFADFTYDIGALIRGGARGRQDPNELSSLRLFAADPSDLAATGESRAVFLYEAHSRIAQPLTAAFVPLIGFAMLLLGSFSRFGLWRQIAAAITALIAVQFLANSMTYYATLTDGAWPLVYLPVPVAAAVAAATLWLAARPRRLPRGARAAREAGA